jgi:hypothetical protein
MQGRRKAEGNGCNVGQRKREQEESKKERKEVERERNPERNVRETEQCGRREEKRKMIKEKRANLNSFFGSLTVTGWLPMLLFIYFITIIIMLCGFLFYNGSFDSCIIFFLNDQN